MNKNNNSKKDKLIYLGDNDYITVKAYRNAIKTFMLRNKSNNKKNA